VNRKGLIGLLSNIYFYLSAMKYTCLRNGAVALTIVVTLNACQQPAAPTLLVNPIPTGLVAAKSRLKTMVRSGNNFYNEYSYAYNAAGQLVSYTLRTGKDAGVPSQTTRFTYDQQGRLRAAERLPADQFTSARLTYDYDNNGLLKLVDIYEDINRNGQFPLTQTIGFTYNADKLPVQTTVTMGSRVETTKYTYEQANIVKSERLVSSPVGQSSETIMYKHDTTPNPMYGLLMATPTVEVFNKNNILYDGCEMTYTDGMLTTLRPGPKRVPTENWQVTYAYEKN
jgi:YD repeat-containing protein